MGLGRAKIRLEVKTYALKGTRCTLQETRYALEAMGCAMETMRIAMEAMRERKQRGVLYGLSIRQPYCVCVNDALSRHQTAVLCLCQRRTVSASDSRTVSVSTTHCLGIRQPYCVCVNDTLSRIVCGPQEPWVAQGAPSEPGVSLRSHGWLRVPHLNQVWASGAMGAPSEPGVGVRSHGWLKVPHLNQVWASGAMGDSRCSI
ncbi:hypothetical protein LSAT2_005263 [Lamellibrachia satsuma]|nr:hypothetical protein LSAT2_005263 [Lamellibrachia satsuma]